MLAAGEQRGGGEMSSVSWDAGELDAFRLPRTFGDYVLEEELGQGGMGVVYRARQLSLDRIVAVKLLLLGAYSSAETIARFRREARAAAGLKHPNIVAIHQVGEQEGHPFLAMEYVAGRDLAQVVKVGLPEPKQAVQWILGVARAIEFAHAKGIVHRDVKPSNVIVDKAGVARLTDFGLASRMADDANLTVTGRVMGTPNYLSPEAAAGMMKEAQAPSDIYGIGAVLYELLTGRPPFLAPSLPEVLRSIREVEVVPPRALNPQVPRDIETVCLKCLEKDPGSRYASAAALCEDCERVLDGRLPVARRPGPMLLLRRWAQRHAVAVLLVSAALVVASIGYAVLRELRAERDLARQFATLNTALGGAELSSRNGRWREALDFWGKADAAGYRDQINLGLRRAEAWTELAQPERAGAELRRISRRGDLGDRRGVVLLYLGEHAMFNSANPGQGLDYINQAVKAGLTGADECFAQGLLAESTPGALEALRRTLKLNPFHHGAHRHSLGLEQFLGRHQELAEHLRVFKTLFPDDPAATFVEATELAVNGRVEDALTSLTPVESGTDPGLLRRLRSGLRLLGLASQYYDVDAFLAGREFNHAAADGLLAEVGLLPSGADVAASQPGLSPFRLPELPCLQNGVREALEALQILRVPLWNDLNASMLKIKTAWKHHPEALLPMFAAACLDSRHPREGPKSLALLSYQAELFQLAADSPSILPNLVRLARYRTAITQFELAGRSPTNAAPARLACLAEIRQALAAGIMSDAEGRAYFPMALTLRDHDLARNVLRAWQPRHPDDPAAVRAGIELEVAVGAFGTALKLLDQRLAQAPDDSWAGAQRQLTLNRLSEIFNTARSVAETNH